MLLCKVYEGQYYEKKITVFNVSDVTCGSFRLTLSVSCVLSSSHLEPVAKPPLRLLNMLTVILGNVNRYFFNEYCVFLFTFIYKTFFLYPSFAF